MRPDGQGALRGVVVIDLANERAELTGRVLADLGATVIKIEPPGGTTSRSLPPFVEGADGRESLYWAAVGLGTRSIVLDLESKAGREELGRLVAAADVFIESFDPGTLAETELDYDHLTRLNPALVYVSVTPFGQSGPDALSPATELTTEGAGGLLGLQGDGDRPPIPVGYPQAAFHAGVQAAADTIIALNERAKSGWGQHLDVSMQAAMVWTLLIATGFPSTTGSDPPRTGERRADSPPELAPGVSLPLMWPCADGYVHGALAAPGPLGGETFQGIVDWMMEEGVVPDDVGGVNWRAWREGLAGGTLEPGVAARGIAAVLAFSRTQTKQAVMTRALRNNLLLAPILTIDELLNDGQLKARRYWRGVGGRLHPGPFARMPATPIRFRRAAPALDEGRALLDRMGAPAPPRPAEMRPRPQPFDGLKVADFSWVAVGPIITKALADHGATVVRVESATRPDPLRLTPPFRDNRPGIDRSQTMANFNTSKLGIALDLSTESGKLVARRLVEWADVVVESFTPGTMERLGLGYAASSRQQPELIMLSASLRGQTGPQRGYSGFGGQGTALSGLHGITGWPDRPPAGPWGAITDLIAPRYGVAALAAAILYRHETGIGQHIDLSQIEASIHFIAPLILDYTVNGRVAGPIGLDSDRACPHGVYRTSGVERYVALAVETPEQWRALLSVAPLRRFSDAHFALLPERMKWRNEIDEDLRGWSELFEAWELAGLLKRAGVPASVVLRPSDLYRDPQLKHREFFVTLDHPVMGATPYDGLSTRFSATPGRLRKAAPCLGEDSDYVLQELLGFSPEEVTEIAASGALT